MAGKFPVASELSRELSLFHLTMMGLGMMIGAGVFIGIGNSIRHAGPGGVLLTFSLNGLIAIFTAMSYAELSSAIPRAGGAYNFARMAFGRGTSFVAGWMEWFASSVAGSLYAITFAIYTVDYLVQLGLLSWLVGDQGLLGTVVTERMVAGVIALLFLYINYRGAAETGRIGALMTLGQTGFLVLIGVVGVVVAIKDPSRLQNFDPFLPKGWGALLVTMGFTSVAFEGYEVIAQAGDEAIAPRKNLPKAMLYSVCAVTLTYVAVAFASLVALTADNPVLLEAGAAMAPWEWIGSHGKLGFGKAIPFLMPYGSFFLTLAVIFASTSALNATIFSATRASYALGRDRMLPAFFAKISEVRKTPWVALSFTGVIVIVVASFLPTMDVASSASIMFLLLFFLVNICVIKVRRSMGDELEYGFVMPLFPLFPLLAIVCQGVLAVHLHEASTVAWIIAPLWIGAGVLVYHLYSKSRAVATEEEIQVIEEEISKEHAPYRIMVPVANPTNALDLVRITYKLGGAKNAQVELLHMVPVPDQTPLSAASKYMMAGKEGIVEAMLYLAPQFPLSTTIRYCRNIARGIISAVREKEIDTLLLGWHGRQRTGLFSMGSIIDPVIEQAPCNIVVVRGCGGNQKFRKVLVPLAGGPNAGAALETATILAEPEDGEVVAFSVAGGGKVHFDLAGFMTDVRPLLHLPADRVQAKVVIADDVVDAILKEGEDHDLIVLGATRDPLIYQFTRDSVPEIVAKRTGKPLVMVRSAHGIRRWIRRWI